MVLKQTLEKACQECQAANASHRAPPAVEQLGVPERNSFGGGAASEVSTSYRCRVCATNWEYVVESGYGSGGPFWHMLDP